MNAPPNLIVLFCSVCGELCGIRDHVRIQDEHFERNERCRGGMWVAVLYKPSRVGTYHEVLLAEAASA